MAHEEDPVDPSHLEPSPLWSESTVEHLNTALAAFNAGTKSYLMLKMYEHPKNAMRLDALAASFQYVSEQTDFRYRIEPIQLVRDYIDHNLVAFGLATETPNSVEILQPYDVSYTITPEGHEIGIPAAAFSLWFEHHYNISLYQIFGKTATTSEEFIRTPLVRADVLRILATTDEPLHYSEIHERKSFVQQTKVWADLQVLCTVGILDKIPPKKTTIRPANLPNDHLAIYNACQTLIGNSQELNADTIRTAMALPDDPQITAAIDSSLAFIMNEGLLSSRYRERYALTPTGATIYTDYLVPLSHICAGHMPEEIQTAVDEVIGNLDAYAIESINRYAPFASSTKREAFKHVKPIILSCLRDHPGGLSKVALGQTIGHIPDSLDNTLEELIRTGEVMRIRVGKTFSFFARTSRA